MLLLSWFWYEGNLENVTECFKKIKINNVLAGHSIESRTAKLGNGVAREMTTAADKIDKSN